MSKLKAKPFIDAGGNLVIPPTMLAQLRSKLSDAESDTCEVVVSIGGVPIRLLVKGNKIVEVERLEADPDECTDLLQQARSSMDFWDNPVDDAVWNNA